MPAASLSPSSRRADRRFFAFNAVVSVMALCALSWLLLVHRGLAGGELELRFMPPLNATLNALAAALLVLGRAAIVKGRPTLHKYVMVSAFAVSALFLVGYLAYHAVHGDTRFGGVGAARTAYLVVLVSHVLASVAIVPLALAAFYFAWQKSFPRHVRVTRVLHPLWLYVSVTGVCVFLMLRPYYPA
jgi:putative membrane protein